MEEERIRLEMLEREEIERLRLFRIAQFEEDERLRRIRLAQLRREQLETEQYLHETHEKLRLSTLKDENEQYLEQLREEEKLLHMEYEDKRR